MKFWIHVLLLLACCSVHAEKVHRRKRPQRNVDISRIRGCVNSLTGCPTPPKSKLPAKCNQTSDCIDEQYCHEIFKMCLNPLKPAKPERHMKPPHEGVCTSNADCDDDQVCHAFFGKCFNSLPKPTPSTRARRIPSCVNTTDCSAGQYCHNHFRICLPNLTEVLLPTRPTPNGGCSSDSDCGPSEFCHSLSHLCLRILNTPTASSRPRNRRPDFCSSDSDCKLTEICHNMIGMRRPSDRQGQQGKAGLSTGICILNKKLHAASYSGGSQLNCSRRCGDGECCLESSGMCAGYRQKGDLCVTEDVPFACSCIAGYECVSINKNMGIKKLEKKLKFPKEKRADLIIWKRIKFKVGKCRRKSS